MFEFKTSDIMTLRRGKYHLISVDTNWMGTPMRLGDLTMTSCMLLFIKNQLIANQPYRFTHDNLFFVLNRVGGLMVNDIRSTLSFFPNIWKDVVMDDKELHDYSIRNLINGGNIWSFKMYLEYNGIKLADYCTSQHVVDPTHLCLTGNNKDRIYIMPVRGKGYNVERNMSDGMLVNIINEWGKYNRPIHVITKDNDVSVDLLKNLTGHNNIYECNGSWINILFELITHCDLFISGDCGLTHFVSHINHVYKPSMNIYYKTQSFTMRNPLNQFDEYCLDKQITFTPYSPYKTDNLTTQIFSF